MPPKAKKKQENEDLGLMKAARFGRVKNTVRKIWVTARYFAVNCSSFYLIVSSQCSNSFFPV